jgi:hypothetical protein
MTPQQELSRLQAQLCELQHQNKLLIKMVVDFILKYQTTWEVQGKELPKHRRLIDNGE